MTTTLLIGPEFIT